MNYYPEILSHPLVRILYEEALCQLLQESKDAQRWLWVQQANMQQIGNSVRGRDKVAPFQLLLFAPQGSLHTASLDHLTLLK